MDQDYIDDDKLQHYAAERGITTDEARNEIERVRAEVRRKVTETNGDAIMLKAENLGLVSKEIKQENERQRKRVLMLQAPVIIASMSLLGVGLRRTLKNPTQQKKPCIVCGTPKYHNNSFCSKACCDEYKNRRRAGNESSVSDGESSLRGTEARQ